MEFGRKLNGQITTFRNDGYNDIEEIYTWSASDITTDNRINSVAKVYVILPSKASLAGQSSY